MDRASEPSFRAPGVGAFVVAALVGVALMGATFAGDGSDHDAVLPVGGFAVCVVVACLVAVALGRLPLPRVGRWGTLLTGATAGLVLWTGASVAWSIVPDRSWDTFNKSVAYAAFLALGLALATVGWAIATRLAAWVLSVVLGAVLAWALVAKAIPALDPEGDRVARLREPVGYWNALALLADVAIVLGLWLGTERRHRRGVRVAGGVLVYVATLALLLTLSRAGVVMALAGVALWLVLASERVQGGLLLVAAAGPAALVGAWAFTRPALTEDVAERADRVSDGTVFGGLALIGAALVVVLVAVGTGRELEAGTRRRLGRALFGIAVLAVVAAIAALAVSTADAVSSGRNCSEVVNDPSRLGSLDPNLRLCWWGEARDIYVDNAPLGAGAGSFEVARKRHRFNAGNVLQPHSVPLQQLSDGGIGALVLFVALVLGALGVCVCAIRRLSGPERAAAAALVVAPAVYLGHALVDYSWDFLAVTAPTMVALGVLAAAGRPAGAPRRRLFLALAAILLAVTVLVSFSFPRLADRYERSSTRALVADDFERARDRALWARFFNPVSVDPIFALARIAERRRFPVTAGREYIRAVELQPENPETWFALGLYEFQVRRNLCAAYRFLNNAYTLDPAGNQWVEGGPLDVAREAVDAGGCAPGS